MSWLDDASDNDVLLAVGGMIPMPEEDEEPDEPPERHEHVDGMFVYPPE